MTLHPSLRRKLLLAAVLIGPMALAQNNNIGINNTGAAPATQAILDVSSNFTAPALQKGMLIPRMTAAQRGALATADGLTVYQTDAPVGFYHYSAAYARWFRHSGSGNAWDILGTDLVNSTKDFIGTTDNQSVVFKTNNVERMRFMATSGYLGVGAVPNNALEQLDVNGAIRIWPQVQVSGTPGTNAQYSATSNPGVITYQKDTYLSTAALPDVPSSLLFRGHWGNVGTSGGAASPITTGSVSLAPTTGGWRRLENDYTEVFNANYTQQGDVTCAAGTVEIPQGVAATLANMSADPIVSPYAHNNTPRARHQYMFRASELNAEINQLGANPLASGGLCANQPINSVAFYVWNTAVAKSWTFASVIVKHASPGLTDLSAGFDEGTDPGQACFVLTNSPAQNRPATVGGWDVFNLSTPFVWDGTRNVIVEVVTTVTLAGAIPAVKYVADAGFIASAARNSNSAVGGCAGNFAPAGSCNSTIPGSALPWGAACGTSNAVIARPVVRFGGTVASITPLMGPISGGRYLRYYGGLIAESTMDPIPWGRKRTNFPVGNSDDSYRGPGTVSAEKGIYDNGVRLNDHVFDRAFDGRVAPTDADVFGDGRNLPIRDMAEFTRANRHLPTMRGRDSWTREGGFSLGDLTNQLWTTAETQALYVVDLHDRLNVLEMLSNHRPLSRDESAQARRAVCAMGTLTETEKAGLIAHLQSRTVDTSTQR